MLPCDECKGKCCTYPVMTRLEFKRIKAAHGIPKSAIVKKIEPIASYAKAAFMIHNKDGTCPYLKGGKCSVYALRPLTCKKYGMVSQMPCQYLYPEEAERVTKELYAKAFGG